MVLQRFDFIVPPLFIHYKFAYEVRIPPTNLDMLKSPRQLKYSWKMPWIRKYFTTKQALRILIWSVFFCKRNVITMIKIIIVLFIFDLIFEFRFPLIIEKKSLHNYALQIIGRTKTYSTYSLFKKKSIGNICFNKCYVWKKTFKILRIKILYFFAVTW